MNPLERFEAIERAARIAAGKLWAQWFRSALGVDFLVLDDLLSSKPDPDIALVPIRRIKTEEGEPACETEDSGCCDLFNRDSIEARCNGLPMRPKLPQHRKNDSFYRKPHPDCPVWRDKV